MRTTAPRTSPLRWTRSWPRTTTQRPVDGNCGCLAHRRERTLVGAAAPPRDVRLGTPPAWVARLRTTTCVGDRADGALAEKLRPRGTRQGRRAGAGGELHWRHQYADRHRHGARRHARARAPAGPLDIDGGAHASFTDACALRDAVAGIPNVPEAVLAELDRRGEDGPCAPGVLDSKVIQRITNSYSAAFLATELSVPRITGRCWRAWHHPEQATCTDVKWSAEGRHPWSRGSPGRRRNPPGMRDSTPAALAHPNRLLRYIRSRLTDLREAGAK